MTGRDPGPLAGRYDLIQLDLDGVLYLIDRPIPVAVEVVGRLRAAARPMAFVTNNASRRAADVAGLLTGMGVEARPDEVLTSAGVTAVELADRLPAGSPVLVVGADALREEIRDAGLTPVTAADGKPLAVVQGYGPGVGWADLAEAAVAVRAGALWVATNADRTLPSPRGPLPGNGSLVAVLRTALGREPDLVVGKPAPALFAAAARRAGADRSLVVGDRLDTDIEGAVRAGMDSLLVLTGVSSAADLLLAGPQSRPRYVATDLAGLLENDSVIALDGSDDDPVRPAGGWRVTAGRENAELDGAGSPLEALRLLCGMAWSGAPGAARRAAEVRAASERAGEVLRELGLTG
jgi:HAD superfamily hydrolase (TIGR01450 family)